MNKHLLSFLQEDSTYKLFTQRERDEIFSLFSVLGEVGNYTIHRDGEGIITSISQDMGDEVVKTTAFNRTDDVISTIFISYSDDSFSRLYSFIRDEDGIITSIEVSED